MFGGIDIGSRTVKMVIMENGKVQDFQIRNSGYDPYAQAFDLIQAYKPKSLVATGYGRHNLEAEFVHGVISEIKAHSLGAEYLFPNCKTVIDVGGQDSKAISLDNNGRVIDFRMNDRCAAGTGRFLEIMAKTLGFSIEEFGQKALSAEEPVSINSMCTVFAESEVISLISRRVPLLSIALGVHKSIVDRISALIGRLNVLSDVVFTGGVANNICVHNLLEKKLKQKILIPRYPEITGALGAAIEAKKALNI
jgi:predicted CoA-substrate-specific enzyme activase